MDWEKQSVLRAKRLAGTQRQRLAFNLLRIAFSRHMGFRSQMPRLCPPMIGGVAGQSARLEQRFQLEKNVILAAAKDIGQYSSCLMIDRLPQPALIALLADKAPH